MAHAPIRAGRRQIRDMRNSGEPDASPRPALLCSSARPWHRPSAAAVLRHRRSAAGGTAARNRHRPGPPGEQQRPQCLPGDPGGGDCPQSCAHPDCQKGRHAAGPRQSTTGSGQCSPISAIQWRCSTSARPDATPFGAADCWTWPSLTNKRDLTIRRAAIIPGRHAKPSNAWTSRSPRKPLRPRRPRRRMATRSWRNWKRQTTASPAEPDAPRLYRIHRPIVVCFSVRLIEALRPTLRLVGSRWRWCRLP